MAATEPDMKEPGHDSPQSVDGLAVAIKADPAVDSSGPVPVKAVPGSSNKRGNRDLIVRLGNATSSKLKALFKQTEQLHPGEITNPLANGNGATSNSQAMPGSSGAAQKSTRHRNPEDLFRLGEGTSTELKGLLQEAELLIAPEPSPIGKPPMTAEETRAAIADIKKLKKTGERMPAAVLPAAVLPAAVLPAAVLPEADLPEADLLTIDTAHRPAAPITPSTPEETRAAISKIKKRRKPDVLMRLGETTNTNLQDLIQGAEFFGSLIPPDSRKHKPDSNRVEADIHSSGSRQTVDQSGPRQTVDQSGPRQTVDQSGPRQTVDQSGPRQTVDQSGPRQTVDQSGPRQTVDQSGPRQTVDQSGPRKTIADSGSRKTIDDSGSRKALNQRLKDQSGPRNTVDYSGPRQAIDQRLKEQSGPRKAVDRSGPIALPPAVNESAELGNLDSKAAAKPKFSRGRNPSMLMRLGEATNTKLKNLLQGADFFGSLLSDSNTSSQATDQSTFKVLADSISQSAELHDLVAKGTAPKPKFSQRNKASLLVRLGDATNAKLQALFHNADADAVANQVELDSHLQVQTRKAIPRDFGNQKSRAVLQAPWLMLLLTALIVISLTKLSTIEIRRVVSLKTQAAMPKNLTGMRFASTDRNSQCKFLSSNECEIDTPIGRQKVQYRLLSGQPDFTTFLLGYLRRHELWYHYNASGLVASDGNVLYNPNAPELAIVKKMSWYAAFANRYFRESKLYPNDAEKCKHSDANYTYINPFTHLSDYATIIVPEQQANPDLIVNKSNPAQWRPGAILCTCVVRKKFFIQGCDGDGKALTSSAAGSYYTIACEDGINSTETAQSPGLNQGKSPEANSANRLFVYQTAELDSSVQWERGLCQLLLWSALTMAGLWCYSIHKFKGSREAKFVSIGATICSFIALAAWYICALLG